MSTTTNTTDLTTFRALSFDCYGTLIDWEAGLAADIAPIISALPAGHPWHANPMLALEQFDNYSYHLNRARPTLAYDANLVESARLLATGQGITLPEGVAETIATGPSRWPAFSDTLEGLWRLRRHYKLVLLSNVDDRNIARAMMGGGPLAGVEFDAVYTAEQIGSYKPDHANFNYLRAGVKREFLVERDEELLHVARSLLHDHVPAKELGIRSVWIARGGDKLEASGIGGGYEAIKGSGKLGSEWTFQTIGEFADEVDRQFAEKAKQKK
ncbi:HAD-like domain-containing protein [Chaetomidium leptoderma]|uniref:HAD-like domain-containing protein n=1 Tax=Chaetomidium leptoderma TaxID=669021 RepID=A0AAN6VN18_9PEZI|nr:HAD-like domain-containing protein [Chaetomidium leptoderma]